ncbi:thiaminase II [Schnuerera sp. xch1]|uniref:thiaminase II n=1 Tax=Schnuerera sp. xch1 TaxID=2874283 RepID=UPI001CBBC3D5|nr:thiaminase II [Schnuerera sp. xch1]MBZ2174622.1 thiaminase II [Schnuerera sp. xch1]
MSFSQRLLLKGKPIWESCLRHPFLDELSKGILEEGKFCFYVKQDYVYLIDYMKLFALGMVKSDNLEDMQAFSKSANAIVNIEMDAHIKFAKKVGITKKELEDTKPNVNNLSYTRYMLQVATQGSLDELVAVLLPCMWSYAFIGKILAKSKKALEHPFYREWILTYATEEYNNENNWCIQLMDKLAEGLPERQLKKLEEIFIMSSKYEYMFWDGCYKKKNWPI